MNKKYHKLYIPYGIVSDTELFNGYTTTQLKKSIKWFLFTALLTAIIYIVTKGIELTVLTLIIGCFASIMINIKYNNNYSIEEYVSLLIRYKKAQQQFRYIYKI